MGQKKVKKTEVTTRQRGREKATRHRRTAEDARKLILEAAEKRLITDGPEAIRLQDIAADVGMSHAAIISHHFGNREGLMEALARHASDRLQEAITRVLVTDSPGSSSQNRLEQLHHIVELAAREIVSQGYGRLWAWLIFSGRDWREQVEGMFTGVAHIAHAFRVQWSREDNQQPPELEDTHFLIMLVMRAFIGEALSGRYTQLSIGLSGDEETERRFRLWLAQFVASYRPSTPTGTRPKGRRRPTPAE